MRSIQFQIQSKFEATSKTNYSCFNCCNSAKLDDEHTLAKLLLDHAIEDNYLFI